MITAVLITWRRQHNIPKIVESLLNVPEIDEILIHDNSKGENRFCIKRFELALKAKNDLIYTQDDDCINHDIEKLIGCHKDLTCSANDSYLNALTKPPYSNTNLGLLGWGSLFWKKDIDFTKYLSVYKEDELFMRQADRIFTVMHKTKPQVIKCNITMIDDLIDSMASEDRHIPDREEVINRCQKLVS